MFNYKLLQCSSPWPFRNNTVGMSWWLQRMASATRAPPTSVPPSGRLGSSRLAAHSQWSLTAHSSTLLTTLQLRFVGVCACVFNYLFVVCRICSYQCHLSAKSMRWLVQDEDGKPTLADMVLPYLPCWGINFSFETGHWITFYHLPLQIIPLIHYSSRKAELSYILVWSLCKS